MNSLKLRIKWCKKEQDFVVYYPRKCDCGWIIYKILKPRKETSFKSETSKEDYPNWTLIGNVDSFQGMGLFEVDFIKELTERGYDKTTLKFEVQIDLNQLLTKFSHLLDDMSPREKVKLKKLLHKRSIKL